MPDRFLPDPRSYPQTWFLLDVVDKKEPRLLGQEVVDLSPGAIELRHVARDLRRHAEPRERWVRVQPAASEARLGEEHRHKLSFGPSLAYCIEHDGTRRIHRGEPFRHLQVRFSSRILTPATSAEIGLYFYGRRPATFGFTAPGAVHGYIGLGWEPLDPTDIHWLLQRETGGRL